MASAGTTKVVPLTCHGHSRPITHISFSSLHATTSSTPQYYLLSACKDNNPMLRDGLTGDWIGTFIGHKGAVWSARLSPDAALAATGSADFSAKLWDTFTGEQLATLQHEHIVRAVAFPGGGGGGGGAGAPGAGMGLGAAAPAPSPPRQLATGGMEKKLRIWDLGVATGGAAAGAGGGSATTAAAAAYEIGAGVHGASIKSIVWGGDANVLTTACDDKKIRWWDVRARSVIATHEVDGPIGSCEMNDGVDGAAEGLLSVAAGKHVYFFDGARPGALVKHIKTGKEVASVAVSGVQRKFVTGGAGDTWVHVWDWDQEIELETGKGHHGPVWTVSFSPDGKLYATGSEDGTIKLWKATKEAYGLWR